MKITKSDWVLINEAKRNGLLVSMTRIATLNRTNLNKELSAYFTKRLPGYLGIFDEDEGEGVLYNINTYLKENNINKRLEFPLSSGDNVYLVPITKNLQLEVLVVDEYYGSGDYEKYVAIENFVINKYATKKDIDELIVFVQRYLI